jgi:hypothetical protein
VSPSSPTHDDQSQVSDAIPPPVGGCAASAGLTSHGIGLAWWRPSASIALVWMVGGAALAPVGVALFASLYAAAHGGATSFTMRISDLPLAGTTFVVLVVLLFAAHEFVHALVLVGHGVRPRFGVQLTAGVLPALSTTAPGEQFTRPQFPDDRAGAAGRSVGHRGVARGPHPLRRLAGPAAGNAARRLRR